MIDIHPASDKTCWMWTDILKGKERKVVEPRYNVIEVPLSEDVGVLDQIGALLNEVNKIMTPPPPTGSNSGRFLLDEYVASSTTSLPVAGKLNTPNPEDEPPQPTDVGIGR